MNRYVIDGLVSDLRAGKTIALMGLTRAATRVTFRAVAGKLAGEEVERVRMSNDSEEIIHTSGGSLLLLAARPDSLRGLSLTTLVIADWYHLDPLLASRLIDQARVVGATGDLEIVRL